MDQQGLDNLFRLMALELVVIETLAGRYLSAPEPAAAAKDHREQLRNLFSGISAPFPGLDAAENALVVDGVADAIDNLVEQAGDMAASRAAERRV